MTAPTYTTIDQIVDDLMFKIEPDVKTMLLKPTSEKKIIEHWEMSSMMRWIRNHYSLWHTSPLTKRWREDGPNDIREGVDHSMDHPDNISSQIIDRLVERLRK